jgi:hypothetical protein
MLDKNITAIWTGTLVACLILVLILGHKDPVTPCYAYVKDGNGNTHVMQGWKAND